MKDLIEKLEQAEVGSRELDCLLGVLLDGFYVAIPRYHGAPIAYGRIDADGARTEPGHGGDQLVPRYTTSLDAALALAERVLPGCCVLVGDYKGLANHTRWNGKGEIRATKGWCSLSPDDAAASNYRVHAHTPALALCAAILRAQSEARV